MTHVSHFDAAITKTVFIAVATQDLVGCCSPHDFENSISMESVKRFFSKLYSFVSFHYFTSRRTNKDDKEDDEKKEQDKQPQETVSFDVQWTHKCDGCNKFMRAHQIRFHCSGHLWFQPEESYYRFRM